MRPKKWWLLCSQIWWLRCALMDRRQRYLAGSRSLRHWLKVSQQDGSLVAACTGGGSVVAERHYPENDWRDPLSGCQAYYHCHRLGNEHGHLHLFMPAEDNAELSHLLGIALDPRGLPLNLFTVNRWVTNDAWLPAAQSVSLVRQFSLAASEASTHLNGWLVHFLSFYAALIQELLHERDEVLSTRDVPLAQALDDRRLEVLSQRTIEWGSDLDHAQLEWRNHVRNVREKAIQRSKSMGSTSQPLAIADRQPAVIT